MTEAYLATFIADMIGLLGGFGLVSLLAAHAVGTLGPLSGGRALKYTFDALAGVCLVPVAWVELSPWVASVPAIWAGLSLIALLPCRTFVRPRAAVISTAIPPAQIPWTALARQARPFSQVHQPSQPRSRAATGMAA